MNSYLQTLKRFGATTIAGDYHAMRGDARDAAIMAELAQGTKDLGARATLCPVMLATIGLEWDAVQAVARSMAGAWRVNPTARAILEAVQRSGTGRAGSVEEC
jgi:hypothetical protein